MKKNLNLPRQISYAAGSFGHSAMLNILNFQLIYFFVPPENSGLPLFIKQVVFLGIFNTVSIIIASGRLWAAFIDPIVAHKSDNTYSRFGRRIPYMAAALIPASITCILIFFPPVKGISNLNIIWLIAMQLIFFFSISLYITPYMSLLQELGHSEHQRINLTTYMSISWALGMMFAALIPALGSYLSTIFSLSPIQSMQSAIIVVCVISIIFMMLPIITINEKEYCQSTKSDLHLKEALKKTFSNPHFRYYIIADFIYMIALSMIMSGFIFFVTVLLDLSKTLAGKMMAYMVVLSLIFYPIVNILSKKTGKKKLIIFSFLLMGGCFFFIYFLGSIPISPMLQGMILVSVCAFPISVLGTLPTAVLSDIAHLDVKKSGTSMEGMYFSSRSIMIKLGSTVGILIFASLTVLGKDPGNDLGIRLTGFIGFALSIIASVLFSRYKEDDVLKELRNL